MSNNNDELKILMVAFRGIGKTSLLAAMHEEFNKTFERANLQAWTDDSTNTLIAIDECKDKLRNIKPELENQITATPPKDNPWNDKGLVFHLGSGGKKFMKVRFTDPAGEYFNLYATFEQKEYIKKELNECNAVVIPIDATALMQNKSGKVNDGEVGTWHEEKNNPQRITQLLKDAYSNVTTPRLVILAPIKCETYTQTPRDAENLLRHVKNAYSELLDFLKSDSLIDKVAIAITPVQTIGNVTFSHYLTNENGFTKFSYHKTPFNAPYEPKDGDQPLRYILLFLINVFLENKRLFLEQEAEKLATIEAQLSQNKNKLEEAKRELERKEKLLNQRKQMWWLFREVANCFDDRQKSYNKSKDKFEQHNNQVQNDLTRFQSSSSKIETTQEQVKTFNNALFRFAIGCKNSDGFAIIQGHKWLNISQSMY